MPMQIGKFVVGNTKLTHNIHGDDVRSIQIIFEKNEAKVLFGYKDGVSSQPHYGPLDMGDEPFKIYMVVEARSVAAPGISDGTWGE